MKIQVTFIGGSASWQTFISESAQTAAAVLTDPDFVTKVRAWPQFAFTDKSPAQVAAALLANDIVTINVGFYSHPLGWSIAKEEGGVVLFNTSKRSRGAGSPGNLAHEVMHVLGFSHDGNQMVGNENTVPYRIGQWVDEALTGAAAHARE